MAASQIIGIDLGGTRIRAAAMDTRLRILQRVETLTLADEGFAPTLQRIIETARRVLPTDMTDVGGIGVSAPGPLNPETGVLVAPPNLPGWHNVPLRDLLQEAFGVPVFTGNDANVAALAEAARGVARGKRHVIYVTVSTGIGGGVLVDGQLLLGRQGLAAEVGHMVMPVNGRVSTLEKEAAGPAMARRARAEIENGATSILTDMCGGDLRTLTGHMVGQAAVAGDALALDVVRTTGRLVGLGLVTLLHLFNPEMLIIGGGVTNLGELLRAPIMDALHTHVLDAAYTENLDIVSPALGEDVSLVGAGALVMTRGGLDRLAVQAPEVEARKANG